MHRHAAVFAVIGSLAPVIVIACGSGDDSGSPLPAIAVGRDAAVDAPSVVGRGRVINAFGRPEVGMRVQCGNARTETDQLGAFECAVAQKPYTIVVDDALSASSPNQRRTLTFVGVTTTNPEVVFPSRPNVAFVSKVSLQDTEGKPFEPPPTARFSYAVTGRNIYVTRMFENKDAVFNTPLSIADPLADDIQFTLLERTQRRSAIEPPARFLSFGSTVVKAGKSEVSVTMAPLMTNPQVQASMRIPAPGGSPRSIRTVLRGAESGSTTEVFEPIPPDSGTSPVRGDEGAVLYVSPPFAVPPPETKLSVSVVADAWLSKGGIARVWKPVERSASPVVEFSMPDEIDGLEQLDGPSFRWKGDANRVYRVSAFCEPGPATPPTSDDRATIRMEVYVQATEARVPGLNLIDTCNWTVQTIPTPTVDSLLNASGFDIRLMEEGSAPEGSTSISRVVPVRGLVR